MLLDFMQDVRFYAKQQRLRKKLDVNFGYLRAPVQCKRDIKSQA